MKWQYLCPKEGTYREVMDAVKAHLRHVDRVSVCGLNDRHRWLNKWPWKRVNHGLLFDRESKPKPAFHAIANALNPR